MKNETWTLPDGSEIRVKHEGDESLYSWDGCVMLDTPDPELLEILATDRRGDETPGEVFQRALVERCLIIEMPSNASPEEMLRYAKAHMKEHGLPPLSEWDRRHLPEDWSENWKKIVNGEG